MRAEVLDWAASRGSGARRYDVVLACDVLYEVHAPVCRPVWLMRDLRTHYLSTFKAALQFVTMRSLSNNIFLNSAVNYMMML